METGLQKKPAKGRNLYVSWNGKRYARYPIITPVLNIGENLDSFIEKYGKPYYKPGDFFCISAKVVSVAKKFLVHESQVKVTPLAKFIVKFVTKWPDDIGYSHPRKMQAAIDIVGYPRIIAALIVGAVLKLLGFKGWFYKIAGHNINAIDGFNPVSKPPMNEFAVLPPSNPDKICDGIEQEFGMPTIILDGNNIDNNVMGMSKKAKKTFTAENFMEIVKGNPQGQEDDGVVSPFLIVREVYSEKQGKD